jgi:hypothetical protein
VLVDPMDRDVVPTSCEIPGGLVFALESSVRYP